jgi:hypothetical protein
VRLTSCIGYVQPASELDEWATMTIEDRLQREPDLKRIKAEIAPYIAEVTQTLTLPLFSRYPNFTATGTTILSQVKIGSRNLLSCLPKVLVKEAALNPAEMRFGKLARAFVINTII